MKDMIDKVFNLLKDAYHNQIDDCVAGLVASGVPLKDIKISNVIAGTVIISIRDNPTYAVVNRFDDNKFYVETCVIEDVEPWTT